MNRLTYDNYVEHCMEVAGIYPDQFLTYQDWLDACMLQNPMQNYAQYWSNRGNAEVEESWATLEMDFEANYDIWVDIGDKDEDVQVSKTPSERKEDAEVLTRIRTGVGASTPERERKAAKTSLEVQRWYDFAGVDVKPEQKQTIRSMATSRAEGKSMSKAELTEYRKATATIAGQYMKQGMSRKAAWKAAHGQVAKMED